MDIADFITRVGFPVAVAVYLLIRQHKSEERCAAENKALRAEIAIIKTEDRETQREIGRTMKETNRLVRHIFKVFDDERTPLEPQSMVETDSNGRHPAIKLDESTETIVRKR